jgi:hypothetical protein
LLEDGFEEHAAQADVVHAAVVIEANIFCSYKGVDYRRGYVAVSYFRTVLDVKPAKKYAVGAINLRSHLVPDVAQVAGPGGFYPHPQQEEKQKCQRRTEDNSRPPYLGVRFEIELSLVVPRFGFKNIRPSPSIYAYIPSL